MTVRKLALYIGLPSYGLVVSFIPIFVPNFYIILHFNPVVLMMIGIIMALDDAYRGQQISGIVEIVTVIGNISFWLLLAYCINKFLDHRKTKYRYFNQN